MKSSTAQLLTRPLQGFESNYTVLLRLCNPGLWHCSAFSLKSYGLLALTLRILNALHRFSWPRRTFEVLFTAALWQNSASTVALILHHLGKAWKATEICQIVLLPQRLGGSRALQIWKKSSSRMIEENAFFFFFYHLIKYMPQTQILVCLAVE